MAPVTRKGTLGGISGRLVDPNGAVIVNVDATIYVKNTATGEMKSVPLSRANGEFSVTGLEAGVYDINIPISSAMYSAYEQKSVTLDGRPGPEG